MHSSDDFVRERRRTDDDIDEWVATLTDEGLSSELRYRTSAGDEYAHELWCAVSHFFNHQTHHRGQLTTLLMQLGHDPGVTDLAVLLREA